MTISRPGCKSKWFRPLAIVLLMLCGSFSESQSATNKTPVLLSESASTRAIAFESVSMKPEPFPLTSSIPFSSDTRTRIAIFAMNLELLAGEGASAFTADVQDATGVQYKLKVEYVGRVPGFEGITMVILRLADDLGDAGDVLLRVNLHGVSSNRVRIAIGHMGGGPPDDPSAVATPAPITPPPPDPVATPNPYTDPAFAAGSDGVRFLEQATWGPSNADLVRIRMLGYRAWFDDQFNQTASSYPALSLYPTDSNIGCPQTDIAQRNLCLRDHYSMYPLQTRFFQNALTGPDQLRQRITFALHKILVTSGRDLNSQGAWVGPYLQIFDRNAFGNFRQVLYEITLNPDMGEYLDMRGNSRVSPNENYAREILQLFSIGVDLLNPDGTPQVDSQGNRIPSYDQAQITAFARVFTGWDLATQKPWEVTPTTNVPNYTDPMILVNNSNRFDTGSKTLLNGVVLPAAAPGLNLAQLQAYKTAELNAAIDNIFNHSNTGPYISRELIKQLVTSNPSPSYVERAAAVFNNNGAGVRGDLRALVNAILLDIEARGDVKTDPDYGHLREPVLLTTNILRAFPAVTDYNLSGSRSTTNYVGDIGQDLFNPPTVFSYFPVDYGVPSTTLFGPEFGILSSTTALRRANFFDRLLFQNNGNGITVSNPDRPLGTRLDYSSFQALAGDPQQLVDALDALLMHNSMSPEMKNTIITRVTNITNADPTIQARTRTQNAIYLIASSSQYQVER